MARLIGYARVSTNGQTLDFQVEILEAAGAEMTFQETASGARTDRAQNVRIETDESHESFSKIGPFTATL
jgi:DNA invertase Pin-like site-specific DNA recombinase